MAGKNKKGNKGGASPTSASASKAEADAEQDQPNAAEGTEEDAKEDPPTTVTQKEANDAQEASEVQKGGDEVEHKEQQATKELLSATPVISIPTVRTFFSLTTCTLFWKYIQNLCKYRSRVMFNALRSFGNIMA